MSAADSNRTYSPWRNVPTRAVVIFFVAVFFTFVTMGFIGDIGDLGQEPALRFALGVVLSGAFAVCYAASGVRLRGKFWLAFIPIFVLQTLIMTLLARYVPDPPHVSQFNAAQTAYLERRLTFDCVATTAAVFIGYAGFVFVFISESRRHIRVHAEKATLEAEMAAARAVQQVILPDGHGEPFPGFTVDTVYQPAQQVGGDFFQILPDGEGGLLVVIGDVAGKGLPAAMLVSMLVGSIRTAVEDTPDPAEILRKLHERLVGRTGAAFSTALAARIARNGLVTIANAGHLFPYLDGREIELPGALPLGVDGGGQYQLTNFELGSGSRLTFYTDGVVEAQNQKGELFGFDRAQSISTGAASAIAEAAIRFGQSDDITVVTVARL
jgi:hypothetical protein